MLLPGWTRPERGAVTGGALPLPATPGAWESAEVMGVR